MLRPGRARPADKPAIRADIEQLVDLFRDVFIMEEGLVRQSVGFLFMLAEQRCDGD